LRKKHLTLARLNDLYPRPMIKIVSKVTETFQSTRFLPGFGQDEAPATPSI